MRNVSHNKDDREKTASLRLRAANYQPDADRPFNRLLQERSPKQSPNTSESRAARSPVKKSGTQQIMDLLKEFNVRLKRDEMERERLWKEMEALQGALNRQPSQALVPNQNLEKWKSVMEDNQKALHTQIQKTQALHTEMQSRIETVETTSGSVALRFDDVLTEQKRLSRRVDSAVEDKTRLLQKMDNLENALTQTQDTLRAKALVLLTDQATASKTSWPQKPAYDLEDTPTIKKEGKKEEKEALFVQSKNDNKAPTPHHPVKEKNQEKSRLGLYATAASLVVLLSVAGTLFVKNKNAQSPFYDLVGKQEQAQERVNSVSFDDVDMATLAPSMNAIEPSALTKSESNGSVLTSVQDLEPLETAPVQKTLTSLEKQIIRAEDTAIARLMRNVPHGDLKAIIGEDSALPQIIKDIEAEAFLENPAAQHDLAAIYTAGHGGIKKDYKKAAQWFEQAAYNGVGNARYNLGVLYHQGLGVEQDQSYAIDLYRTAAHVNHPEAQYNLGIAYIEGVGVPQNVGIAAHYFEKAATNNVMEAAYNLGLIYENGLLGKKQPDEALFWYKVASSKGSLEGRQALESLASALGLNPSDVDALISRISILKPDVKLVLGTRSEIQEEPLHTDPIIEQTKIVEAQPIQEKIGPVQHPVVEQETPSSYTLEAGSDAVIVAQIQEQLIQSGLYPGPADGMVGPVTEDAVRAYQTANNMKVDGIASEDLLVHMLAREFELNTYPSSDLFEDVGSQE